MININDTETANLESPDDVALAEGNHAFNLLRDISECAAHGIRNTRAVPVVSGIKDLLWRGMTNCNREHCRHRTRSSGALIPAPIRSRGTKSLTYCSPSENTSSRAGEPHSLQVDHLMTSITISLQTSPSFHSLGRRRPADRQRSCYPPPLRMLRITIDFRGHNSNYPFVP